MGRYPRAAREAAIKCIACNAPVTETVEGAYVCVECGKAPISRRTHDEPAGVPSGSTGD